MEEKNYANKQAVSLSQYTYDILEIRSCYLHYQIVITLVSRKHAERRFYRYYGRF